MQRRLGCGVLAMLVGIAIAGAADAKDRKFERDWRTGVTVAPGASTWTDTSFEEKKRLIAEVAATEGKSCSHVAALQWQPEAGSLDALRADTAGRYRSDGFSLTEKAGAKAGDTVWIVANGDLEAVVLWSMAAETPVYLSCITAGNPAADPDKPLIVAIFGGIGLALLALGAVLIQRVRSRGRASLRWPSTSGIVTSGDIQRYKVHGGYQYQAKVTYDYKVSGRAFTGNTLRFGAYATEKSGADADLAKYPAGKSVQVRYDPLRPEVSVLEPGMRGSSVMGIVCAVLGVILIGVAALMQTMT